VGSTTSLQYYSGQGANGVVIIRYLTPVGVGSGVSMGSACCMCVGM
jgi:hypothetical protein